MKTSLLLFAALLRAGAGHTQQLPPDQVPPLPFVALQKQYPQATQVHWTKVQGLYQANFTQGQSEQAVRFSNNGDVAATVTPMAPGALPASVRHTLATRYADQKICKAAKIVSAPSGAITYEAEPCDTPTGRVIPFTADGRKVRRPPKK